MLTRENKGGDRMNVIIENFLIVGAQATILIVLAIVFRRALKKNSKVFVYSMWLLILLRLCIPVTTGSRLGLIDRQKEVPVVESMDMYEDAYWQERYESNNLGNLTTGTTNKEPVKLYEQLKVWEKSQQNEASQTDEPKFEITKEEALIAGWILGMLALLTITIFKLIKQYRKIAFAINVEENVWEMDNIDTAFVMGLFKARIYLPTGLPLKEREYILSHEKTHIKHKDHIVRILMLLVNIVYWWNPFVWLAVWLMKKDMEMLCDEAVVRELDENERKRYLSVLLNNSARNSGIIPVMSFGESNTKMRIEHIINLKKSGAYALVAIVCFAVLGLVGCTTMAKHRPANNENSSITENPSTESATTETETTEETTQKETESSTDIPVYVPKEGVYFSEDSDSTIFITIDGLGVEIWDTSKFDRGQAPEHYAGRTDYSYYVRDWDINALERLGITAISDNAIEYEGVKYTFDRGALYKKGGDYTINHTGYPQYDEIIDEIVDLRINGNASFGEPAINDFSYSWRSWYMFNHGGFYLIDLDNNGTPEMFLGYNGESAWQGTIYEVYTIKDGQAVKLLDGGERYNSKLCSDNSIYFDSSSGAANSEMGFYKVQNGELVLDVGLIFDGNEHTGDPNNPWNLCEDKLSKDNSVSITEEEAWGIINSYTTIPIEFTHFCNP